MKLPRCFRLMVFPPDLLRAVAAAVRANLERLSGAYNQVIVQGGGDEVRDALREMRHALLAAQAVSAAANDALVVVDGQIAAAAATVAHRIPDFVLPGVPGTLGLLTYLGCSTDGLMGRLHAIGTTASKVRHSDSARDLVTTSARGIRTS
jgi:hypothetical protein